MTQKTADHEIQVTLSSEKKIASPDRLTLTELVIPAYANHYGTLFGPQGLSLLGKAAYLVARSYDHQSMLMVGANNIEFLLPIPVGSLLEIHAQIVHLGNTSMTVRVRANFYSTSGVYSENAMRGEFNLVAIDGAGKPTPITAKYGLSIKT